MFICLSPGGQSITQGETPKEKLLVGTVDGIFAFHKRNGVPRPSREECSLVPLVVRVISAARVTTHNTFKTG